MLKGFKTFLMQGNLITIAVGLVIALAFEGLISAFTGDIITPLVNSIAGGGPKSKGVGFTLHGQRIELGAFISAIIFFVIFIAVVYFVIVVPYRAYMARSGTVVYGPPAAKKTCPECLSDIPLAATRCMYCTAEQPPAEPAATP